MLLTRSLTLFLLSAPATAWITAPSPLFSQRLSTSSSLVERFSTVEASSATASSTLSPEFEDALTQAKAQLIAATPSEEKGKMGAMLPLLEHFMTEYMQASQHAFEAGNTVDCNPAATAKRILTGISYGLKHGLGDNTYKFDVSHTALRGNPEEEDGNTVDYYAFGCDFFRPCMDLANSQVLGRDNLQQAMDQMAAGENVVLLANHQSEADPQVVSVGLEVAGHNKAAEDMVYVAGHKVTTDALAIPFSMGRNLICIHSKKHINADPDTKPLKQRQNLKAMSALLNKFKAGGTLLWVAPSGGRDRRDVDTGDVPLAPFDSKTIDMFRLLGNKAGVPTHFYTLAMVSYDLCPPPDHVEAAVGEQRNVRFVPVGIAVGDELENTGGLESRHAFCDTAMEQCVRDYETLLKEMGKKSD